MSAESDLGLRLRIGSVVVPRIERGENPVKKALRSNNVEDPDFARLERKAKWLEVKVIRGKNHAA